MTLKKTTLLFLILIFTLILILILLRGVNTIKAYPEFRKSPTTRIVFFGDSITAAGVRPGGYVTSIKDALKQQYPNHSIEVIGAGVSGNKVSDLQTRLEKDVIAKRPNHVVIYIGINDVWYFYEFDQVTGTDRVAFEQGLRDLIARIRETGAAVSLCTPSVIGENPDSGTPVNQRLMEYADIARTVANTSEAHLCDLRSAFEQYLRLHNLDKAYEGILTTDGIHLNDDGNRFVAHFLLEHLLPLLTPLAKLSTAPSN